MKTNSCILECSLILYKQERFSYGHLSVLSLEIILRILDYFNILFILDLNSEFRNFKLWDQINLDRIH